MNDNCENFKLQIQALADGETEVLCDGDLLEVFSHLSSCKKCREQYSTILSLKKIVRVQGENPPSEEWFEKLEKKRGNKILRRLGYFLIIIPYILLIGLGISELFVDTKETMIVKVSFGVIILGFLTLLSITIAGRIKESKNDKYKEIMK